MRKNLITASAIGVVILLWLLSGLFFDEPTPESHESIARQAQSTNEAVAREESDCPFVCATSASCINWTLAKFVGNAAGETRLAVGGEANLKFTKTGGSSWYIIQTLYRYRTRGRIYHRIHRIIYRDNLGPCFRCIPTSIRLIPGTRNRTATGSAH